ncbi:MAG TPA: HAMP domain-containing sensor histidine kinase [Gemmatimonadales bacterium]|jgi:signal transduction histidine kinase|nr:HAMP domain-containing sensor histidine kinase [Gemmatimonadales bacterium]HEV8598041.1 HAMP domain-containing sensor histidine kinase [Gemmatimonadales bacterium]
MAVSAEEPVLSRLLTEAARELVDDWQVVRQDAASREEVVRALATLTAALAAGLAGEAPPDLSELSKSQLPRRLLGLLRGRLVRRAAGEVPPPSGSELLSTLLTFELVGQQLEPNWDQRFADRLTGPDGLELVVELAHDLRSPLTSILFLGETIKRGRSGPVTPLQERQLGLIYSAAFGLSSVASDVIELARGGDRLVDLEPLPFAIQDIMESVRDIVQPIAEEKGLEVRLSPCQRGSRVGHPVALSRILLNLTTNALKFTDEGSVEVSATEVGETGVEFSVRDTGRGIPPQAMAMLFEPFRRRQKDRDYAFSGSGLGLSICRKLVEAMQGDLSVETTGGVGTRFYFTLQLPLAESGER